MRVLVRVDASAQIGTGHVMRCLALASELKNRRHEVIFLCRELKGNLIATIEASGFKVIKLQKPSGEIIKGSIPHSHWLEVSQQVDLQESLDVAGASVWDWIVTDHYGLDELWQKGWQAKVLAIDDLADRRLHADILLDQNDLDQETTRYQDFIDQNCRRLIGPEYALLRDEFKNLRPKVKIRTELKSILVFLGGVDLGNTTVQILKVLQPLSYNVKAIIGHLNPHYDDISRMFKSRFHIQKGTQNMAQDLLECDVAIGAGGVSTWERFCMGCPSIVVTIAANQEDVANSLQSLGYHIYLGRDSAFSSEALLNALKKLEKPENLAQYSDMGQKLVDGRGCERVVTAMESLCD